MLIDIISKNLVWRKMSKAGHFSSREWTGKDYHCYGWKPGVYCSAIRVPYIDGMTVELVATVYSDSDSDDAIFTMVTHFVCYHGHDRSKAMEFAKREA